MCFDVGCSHLLCTGTKWKKKTKKIKKSLGDWNHMTLSNSHGEIVLINPSHEGLTTHVEKCKNKTSTLKIPCHEGVNMHESLFQIQKIFLFF